tara:strand:- start:1490 stop:1786 length:297 start_codon:yes stop_codon:yes gene_type:complete
MFLKNNFLIKSNLKSHLKRYKSALIYSFIIGLLMGFIPLIFKLQESLRVQKLIQEQREIQIKNKEKICKNDNSEYKKFLNLGFPKTANEKFNICMKEK